MKKDEQNKEREFSKKITSYLDKKEVSDEVLKNLQSARLQALNIYEEKNKKSLPANHVLTLSFNYKMIIPAIILLLILLSIPRGNNYSLDEQELLETKILNEINSLFNQTDLN